MSEQLKTYRYQRKDLDGVRNTTLLLFDQGWEQPTPEELQHIINYAGELVGKKKLTGAEVANIIGVNSRTVRKYTAPVEAKNYRSIPYAAWRLLLIYAGLVEPEQAQQDQQAAEG